MPPPQSPLVHQFCHCRLTATHQPGSSSCFLCASLSLRRTVASMLGTDLRWGWEKMVFSNIRWLNNKWLNVFVLRVRVLPLLSCQIRIFQMLPRLVSVAMWKMSRALRVKAPLLSRWRCPLRLSRPYKLIPTWAVVPKTTETHYINNFQKSVQIVFTALFNQ